MHKKMLGGNSLVKFGRKPAGGVCVLIFAGALTLAGAPAALADGGHSLAAAVAGARAGIITTVAGGPGGPAPGRTVALDKPCGVASGRDALYFTEAAHDVVRRLDPRNGVLSTADGTGATGLDGIGGSPLWSPCAVAVDAAGNLVIADVGHDAVKVKAARDGVFYGARMRAGHVYVVGGAEAFQSPDAVAVDRHGNLLVTTETQTGDDSGTQPGEAAIYVLAGAEGTFYGQAMVPGNIYPLAGCISLYCPPGFGDDGPVASATFGSYLPGVVVDRSGNVLIADADNGLIRVVAAATGRFYGRAMTAGDVYTIAGGGSALGDGGPAGHAMLGSPHGVALDRAGNVLLSDPVHERIRLVAVRTGRIYGRRMTAGDIYTLAGNGKAGFVGDGGPALRAELNGPGEVAFDSKGNLAFIDQGDSRVRLVAARTGVLYGRKMTAGHIYTVAGNGQAAYLGDGGLATRAELSPFFAAFSDGGDQGQLDPDGLAVSRDGSIVVADSAENRVRLVAARSGVFYGHAMTARHIYTVAGTGTSGFSGDGGPATRARLFDPGGIAVDRAGNIVVSDLRNERIRVIAARTGSFYGRRMTTGNIYTLAKTSNPVGLAVDGNGNVIAADGSASLVVVAGKTGRFYGQQMTAGKTYTLQPAPVGEAFMVSTSVAVDHLGNLVVGNVFGPVLVIPVKPGTFYGMPMIPGHAYLVAGGGNGELSGDGGPAINAGIGWIGAVAVDAAGNLLVADTTDDRIRVVAEHDGTFYGVKMTAGDIYTVAGSGTPDSENLHGGFSGDGGPATKAVLFAPCGIAPYGKGLLILDDRNNRVRAVSG